MSMTRPALLHDLGALPFRSGAPVSRSLWVIFIGEWGVWHHATLPVDDRLDMPDEKNITGLCDLIFIFIRPPRCHDDEKAMIVLRRPGCPAQQGRCAHLQPGAPGSRRPGDRALGLLRGGARGNKGG